MILLFDVSFWQRRQLWKSEAERQALNGDGRFARLELRYRYCFSMSEELKRITDNAEIVDFGEYLNSLDNSVSFEIENQAGQMKTSSHIEVIKSFQDFFDRKTDKFKIHITGFRDGKLFVEKKNIIRLATISN